MTDLPYGADLPYDVDLPYGGIVAITRGIDTSSYQDPTPTSDPSDDIDWNLVERTAQDFAIIRLTIGRTTDDVTGLRDLREAVSEQIPIVGAYGVCGYAEPVEDGAKRLVDKAATVADPAKLAFMVDAEDFGDGRHPTIGQVNRYAIQLHADTGRWPVAYVPGWWMSKYGYSVADLELRHCPWAQSHYFGQPWTDERLLSFKPSNLRGFDRLAWLQFASSGTVSGVATRVDLNAAYMTLDQLRAQLLGQEEDMTVDELVTELQTPNSKTRNALRELAKLGSQDTLRIAVAGDKDTPAGPYFAGLASGITGLQTTVEAGIKVSLDVTQLTPDQLELIATVFAGRVVIAGVQAKAGQFVVTFEPA